MMRIIISLVSIFIVMSFGVTSAFAQATKWPINKYKIVQQDPEKPRLNPVMAKSIQAQRDSGAITIGLTTAQMKVLEQYFVDVGEEYQALGFLDPKIDTVDIDRKLGKVFEIFVFDYDNAVGPARYGPSCGGEHLFGVIYDAPKRYIRLDLDRIYSGNSIAPITYDNIAHEMFHAVQRAYPLFQKDTDDRCKLGDWITEATAEAVGADMARALKGVKINEVKIGPRKYSKPLYVKSAEGATKNQAYWTASLWRYIGEYVSNGKKFPPVIQNKPPDYRYLQKFFTKKVENYNEKAELDWLDENLNTHFKTSLANMYANFISGFVHYIPERVGDSPTKFFKALFGGCEAVTINETIGSVSTKTLKFNKVSSHCIEVIYDGPEKTIDVGFYMESDQKAADSIQRIGVQYRTASEKKTIRVLKALKGNWSPDEHYADWLFENVPFVRGSQRYGKKSNIFIVSNVAKKASNTDVSPTVSFEVVFAKSTGTMTVTQAGP